MVFHSESVDRAHPFFAYAKIGDFFEKKSLKKLLEQSATGWKHPVDMSCGKNKNREHCT